MDGSQRTNPAIGQLGQKAGRLVDMDRVRELGLQERITVLCKDYRALSGEYDKLVSVEMIEAVGESHLPLFFNTCDKLLKPGGRLVLQAITMPDEFYDEYSEGGLHDQIPPGFAGPICELDPDRADASPWNDRLPVIRRFRKLTL